MDILGFWSWGENKEKDAGDSAAEIAFHAMFNPAGLTSLFLPGSKPSTPARTYGTNDPTKMPAYVRAQVNLARAEADAKAAQGRLASRSSPSTAIPASVPSFALTPMRTSIPDLPGLPSLNLPPLLPTDSTAMPDPAPDSLQGDTMPHAVAHVEDAAKRHGLHASIAPDGSASCPGCGAPLHVALEQGPARNPGAEAGQVQVVGMDVESKALKAHSSGTCVLTCPACHMPICLSLTEAGYHGGEEPPLDGYHVIGSYYIGRTPPARKGPRKSPHKAAIVNSGKAVEKALKAGANATARAKQYDPSKHKPVLPLTAVHGFGEDPEAVYVHGDVHHIDPDIFGDNVIDVFGVAFGVTPPSKPLTLKQKAAVQKHAGAVVKTAQAAQTAKAAGDRATKLAKDLDAHRKKFAPEIAKFINRASPSAGVFRTGPAGHVKVLGWGDIEVFGLNETRVLPSWMGDDPTEDGTGGMPGTAGALTPVTYDPESDPEVLALAPPVRGQPLTKDEAAGEWNLPVPEDAVKYAGEYGFPNGSIGSFSLMYGAPWINEQQGQGYIWWGNPGENQTWWRIEKGHGDNKSEGKMSDTEILSWSKRLGYGPIVADPKGQLAGLQWSTVDKQWFWQAEKAPAWAANAADAILAVTRKKLIETKQAAAAAENARIDLENRQMEEARVKQEAANALAQSAADTAANISAQQTAAQQAQVDLEAQRAEQAAASQQAQLALQQQQAELQAAMQQAAVDRQAQQADLQAATQQAQMDAQARQIQLDYIKANPQMLEQPDRSTPDDAFAEEGGGDPFASDGQSPADMSDAFTDDAA